MHIKSLFIFFLITIYDSFSSELPALLPTLEHVTFQQTIDAAERTTIDVYHNSNNIGFIYYDIAEKYIYSLHVDTEYRGSAIGTNLFIMALRDFKKHRITRISWSIIPKADSFYVQFGARLYDGDKMEFIFKKDGDPLKNFKKIRKKPADKKNCVIL